MTAIILRIQDAPGTLTRRYFLGPLLSLYQLEWNKDAVDKVMQRHRKDHIVYNRRHGLAIWGIAEREPDNPVDPDAVHVAVDGESVGYFSKGWKKYVIRMMDANNGEDIRVPLIIVRGVKPTAYVVPDFDQAEHHIRQVIAKKYEFNQVRRRRSSKAKSPKHTVTEAPKPQPSTNEASCRPHPEPAPALELKPFISHEYTPDLTAQGMETPEAFLLPSGKLMSQPTVSLPTNFRMETNSDMRTLDIYFKRHEFDPAKLEPTKLTQINESDISRRDRFEYFTRRY